MSLSMNQGKKRATILVLGPTGSGKTRFVNEVTKSKFQVGHSLSSCTDRVQATIGLAVDGCTVTLLDTPGFNHTSKTDVEVLNSTSTFLIDQYSRGELLAGVIYIHPMNNDEPARAAQNVKAFEDICGDKAFQNTAIVTTKWDLGGVENVQTFESRERDLQAGLFARLIHKGARIFRDDRPEAAREIIKYLMQKQPITLKVQRSVIEEDLRLQHTGTGHILLRDLSADGAEEEKLEMLRLPRGEKQEKQQEIEGNGIGLKLRKAEVLPHKLRKRREGRRRVVEITKWDIGEMMICFCCGVALYSFLAVVKQRIWYGVDMTIL